MQNLKLISGFHSGGNQHSKAPEVPRHPPGHLFISDAATTTMLPRDDAEFSRWPHHEEGFQQNVTKQYNISHRAQFHSIGWKETKLRKGDRAPLAQSAPAFRERGMRRQRISMMRVAEARENTDSGNSVSLRNGAVHLHNNSQVVVNKIANPPRDPKRSSTSGSSRRRRRQRTAPTSRTTDQKTKSLSHTDSEERSVFVLASDESILWTPSSGVMPTFQHETLRNAEARNGSGMSQSSLLWRPKLAPKKNRAPKASTSLRESNQQDSGVQEKNQQEAAIRPHTTSTTLRSSGKHERKRRRKFVPQWTALRKKRGRDEDRKTKSQIASVETHDTIIVDDSDIIYPSPQLRDDHHRQIDNPSYRSSSVLSQRSTSPLRVPSPDRISVTHPESPPQKRLGQMSSRSVKSKSSPNLNPVHLSSNPSLEHASLIGITHSEKSTSPMVFKDLAFKRLDHVVKQIPQEIERESEKMKREQRLVDKERYKDLLLHSSGPKKRIEVDNEKYHPLTRSSKYCKKQTGYRRDRQGTAHTEGILEPYTGSKKRKSPVREKHRSTEKKKSSHHKKAKDSLDLEHEEAKQKTAQLMQSVEDELRRIDQVSPMPLSGVDRSGDSKGAKKDSQKQALVSTIEDNSSSRAQRMLHKSNGAATSTTTNSTISLFSRFPFASSKNDFNMWDVEESSSMGGRSQQSPSTTESDDVFSGAEVSLRFVGEPKHQPPQIDDEEQPLPEEIQLALAEASSPPRRRGVMPTRGFMKPTQSYVAALNTRPQSSPIGGGGEDEHLPRRPSLPSLDTFSNRRKQPRKPKLNLNLSPVTPKRRVLDFTKTPFPNSISNDNGEFLSTPEIPEPPHESNCVDSPPTPKYLKDRDEFHVPTPDPEKEESRKRKERAKQTLTSEDPVALLAPVDFSARIPDRIKKKLLYAEKQIQRRAEEMLGR